jgi:hypothetical protein
MNQAIATIVLVIGVGTSQIALADDPTCIYEGNEFSQGSIHHGQLCDEHGKWGPTPGEEVSPGELQNLLSNGGLKCRKTTPGNYTCTEQK